VEPYWPGLFAKALEGISVKDLITSVGSCVGAGSAPGGGGGGGNSKWIIFTFVV
jgi:large subunit ribosomal protein LP1